MQCVAKSGLSSSRRVWSRSNASVVLHFYILPMENWFDRTGKGLADDSAEKSDFADSARPSKWLLNGLSGLYRVDRTIVVGRAGSGDRHPNCLASTN